MNDARRRFFETHVPILGILFLLCGALYLVIGAVGFVVLAGIGAITGDGTAALVLSIVGTLAVTIMGLLALPSLLAGAGLLRRRSWGRIVAIVVAFLKLPSFPLGTALGIYAIWVLLYAEDAAEYFGAPPAGGSPAATSAFPTGSLFA